MPGGFRYVAALALLLAAGCGLQRETLEVGDATRVYHLHQPNPAPEGLRPLLIVLHPFSRNGVRMAWVSRFNAIADREGFIAAYPDGLQRSWNALDREGDARDDVAFIAALVDDAIARHGADPQRVYLAGASNGAMMVYRMLGEMGERFAGAAVVMGAGMPEQIADGYAPSRPVPLVMIHGTLDAVLPYEGGRVFAGPGQTLDLLGVEESFDLWRAWNGCAGSVEIETAPGVERWSAAQCAADADVVLYRVIGGGHTWPGGRRLAPRFIVGRTSDQLDASEVVWAFLAGRALPPD